MSEAFAFPAAPTLNQIVTLPNGAKAQWNGTDWVSLDATGTYVLKTGDTMTGLLTIKTPVAPAPAASAGLWLDKPAPGVSSYVASRTNTLPRWIIRLGDAALETGSDVGSNFTIERLSDAGALIGNIFQINRATGQAVIGPGAVEGAYTTTSAVLQLAKAGSGNYSSLMGTSAGKARWNLVLGDSSPESADGGSNFGIQRYNDAGVSQGTALAIDRATGVTTLTAVTSPNVAGLSVNSNSGLTTFTQSGVTNSFGVKLSLIKSHWSQPCVIEAGGGITTPKWRMTLGSSTLPENTNDSNDFSLGCFSDANVYLFTPFIIKRSNGIVQMPHQPAFSVQGCNAAAVSTYLTWGAVSVNVGGYFNNATGRFTAPIAGRYFFRANAHIAAGPAIRLGLRVNSGSEYGSYVEQAPSASGGLTASVISAVFVLSAGDYVSVYYETGSGVLFNADTRFSSFAGFLIS